MTRPLTRVLIVDPDRSSDDGFIADLRAHGYAVHVVRDGGAADLEVRLWRPRVVLLELELPDESGVGWLQRVRRLRDAPPVIVVTAHATVGAAVEAMSEGAVTVLEKPVTFADVQHHLLRALAMRPKSAVGEHDNDELEPEVEAFGTLVSRAPAMREVFRLARAAAPTDATVLIVGESGTGKELMASAIHHHSRRASGPYIRLNCTAIPGDLLESELFGHRRGAFTGAATDKKGLLDVARGGSMLLDEIAEMPHALQVKLLRVLQEREFRPVGDTLSLTADVRIICATNVEPSEAVRRGALREDLLFRLNTIVLALPPLRDRSGDIPLLASRLVASLAERHGRPVDSIDVPVLKALEQYPWPGNVRELEHVLERAVILCGGPTIRLEHLPEPIRAPGRIQAPALPAGLSLDELERLAIIQTLERTRGNKRAAAAMLGIHRPTLYNKLRKYGLWRVGTGDDAEDA